MRRLTLAFVLVMITTGCVDPSCSAGTEYDGAMGRCICREPRVWTGEECIWPADSIGGDAGERDAAMERDGCVEVEYFRDGDGDGFGTASDSTPTCGDAPSGYVANGDDCDDACADCFPGAPETCDGRDEDCNGYADGDDLCDFGQTCIDAECKAAPIYRSHTHLRPRIGGAVTNILIAGTSSGEAVALVTYTGTVDVGSTVLFGASQTTSISLIRFDAAGEILESNSIGTAYSGSSVSARSLAVDEAGNAYFVGAIRGTANVLARSLREVDGASFVARVTPEGGSWVQRYGSVTVNAIDTSATGFVACAGFSGTVNLAGATLTADSNGDSLILIGESDGNVARSLVVRGPGYIHCDSISAHGERAIAVGTYGAGTLSIDRFMFGEPAGTDVWTVGLSTTGAVHWAVSGGGPGNDRGTASLFSSSGAFTAAGTMGLASFGDQTSDDTVALALVHHDEAGRAQPLFAQTSDTDGEDPAAWVSSMTASPSGAPIIALNLISGLSGSWIHFGPITIESEASFGTEGFVLGYSRDGARPRWIAPISGPATREVVVAATGTTDVVAAGVFDQSVRVADGVELVASASQQDAFIVRYRVR